jgi:D-alanyl-D-alanine carboxypeptidase (penicillin-binding protein 5/6)
VNIKKIGIYTFSFVGILLIALLAYSYFSPLPPIKTIVIFKPNIIQNKQKIDWAKDGSQAIGIVGYGVNNQSGSQTPSPIASTIKVLLALSVLSKKPLVINQQGPSITITQADVDRYNADLALGESVVKVQNGEVITEYQALQSLLIASANNFAEILANWVFGSTANYLFYANQYAKNLGMKSTTIVDDSGFSATTVSNAVDLVTLGQQAIVNPVLTNIVSQYTAIVPVAGEIVNYNSNLNPDLHTQIDGIKTGNTTTGGGNYIYSSKYLGYQIVGSIVGTPDLNTALSEGPQVLDAYEKLIKIQKIISKNQIVGYYDLPWGNKIFIYSENNQYIPVEPNVEYSINLNLDQYNIVQRSSLAGYLVINSDQYVHQYPLVSQNTYTSPSLWWRIKYNFKKLY